MKTSNLFIAQQCDQAGETAALEQCIASGQVSAAQVEAHRMAGDFVQTTPVTNADIDAAREALDSLDDFARMTVGVNAIGPRSVLERFIANVATIAQPPEPDLKALVQKVHSAKGRHHNQIAMCDLYDACGLSSVRPTK